MAIDPHEEAAQLLGAWTVDFDDEPAFRQGTMVLEVADLIRRAKQEALRRAASQIGGDVAVMLRRMADALEVRATDKPTCPSCKQPNYPTSMRPYCPNPWHWYADKPKGEEG